MTQPITSPNEQPGFVPNEGGNWTGQKGTYPYWKQTLAEYMASEWAHGNRDKVLEIISPTWYSAKYGEPDPSDQYGKWSDRTLLAFSKWASEYQPGWSPYIDQVLPYVPPGPNDFIETPEQTASRIAQKEINDEIVESARQFDITEGRTGYANWFANELERWQTEMGMFQFGEGERGTNLRKAGDLASALQTAYDARTKSALERRADPGDYILAEYESRALNPPAGTTSPAYKDVDSLADVIRRLIEYSPGTAPTAPVQRPFTPAKTRAEMLSGSGMVNEPAPALPGAGAPPVPGQPVTIPKPEDVPSWVTNRPPPQGNYNTGGGGARSILMPDGTVRSQGSLAGFAHGIRGTRDRQFIAGDPQMSNAANPELVEVRNPGPKTKVDVTPIQKVSRAKLRGKRMYAFGTDDATITTYPDSAYQNQPRQKYLQGGSAKDYNKLATGFAGSAFGMKVPAAGRINYGKMLNIADDPVALAMTAADYKAANRDLFSLVARAKARAPLGQSVNTSLVRY